MKGIITLIEILFIIAITAFVFYKCGYLNTSVVEKPYRHIGDIEYDAELDNPDFAVCHPEKIFQYFNNGSGPEYSEDKADVEDYFFANYRPIEIFEESGWVRIRFVVNCKGEAGRYRLLASDSNYQEKQFDERITSQLLNLTKAIPKWPSKMYREEIGDYYMYLIFKIKDGQLIELMP